MTATAASTNGWRPEGTDTQLPAGANPGLAANEEAGLGQNMTYDASGNAVLNDGTVPCVVAAGVAFPAKLSPSSPVAGAAQVQLWCGYGGGNPSSTISGDNFTDADVCTPAWGASENALGKLSNHDGDNRPLMGLVLGLSPFSSSSAAASPRAWVGPVAQAVARGVMMANAYPFLEFNIADAAASTAISERVIGFAKVHGLVTSVQFSGAAVAADNSDYATITIAKRSSADDYAAATTVAEYDTRAANEGAITAWVPADFDLEAAANLQFLEDDIITITTAKGGSGKAITGTILVNGKAI